MEQKTKESLPLSQRYALSLAEASQYVSLSIAALRGAYRRGELPHFRRGRKVLFRRADLERWIEQGR